jgi:lactoylglutathione lyase
MGISDGLGHPYVKGSVFRLLPRWAGIGRGDRDCVLDEALAFYGRLFRFELRGKSDSMAFIDLGDQFIALQKGRKQPADDGRHFGLVVDDKEAARKALEAAGVFLLDGPFLDFRDPWGNRVEIIGYDNIQFTKAPNVLRGHGSDALGQERESEKGIGREGYGAGVGPIDRAVGIIGVNTTGTGCS